MGDVREKTNPHGLHRLALRTERKNQREKTANQCAK
jgi:hypothetical protein